MAPPNEFKEGTIPCGSPNCIAMTLEDLLTKQTDNLNESLKTLIEVQMKGISEMIEHSERVWDKNYTRLEQKHDRELAEVFLRLGKVEGVTHVVENRQVGQPKCIADMSVMNSKITEIKSNTFTPEERKRILTMIDILQSKRKVWMGITITVVSLCIMGVLSFGLFMFGSHNPDKRITQIEQDRIERSEQVNASLKELKDMIEKEKKK